MYLLLDNVEKEFKQTPKKREREREEAMVVIVAGVRQNKRTALP
jgi:hypothetical protein